MTTTTGTNRHCCRPFSHGTLLVLVMSCLLFGAHRFVYSSIEFRVTGTYKIILDCAHYALWVILPVTGWVAESWLGRYRAIVIGLIMGVISTIAMQVAFMALQFLGLVSMLIISAALIISTIGAGSMYTIMLPFTLDQMIGASAEQLSAVVQWYWWGSNIGILIKVIFHCVPIPRQLQFLDILPVVLLVLGTLSLSAVLIMDCLCHKWLDTRDKTGNPIKLIFGVLNYARKNKYPRLRSAFTYIDEEQPSRLDFGKHKFGGPFTEEEVEDVKTIFRLLPLLVVLIAPRVIYDQLGLHAIHTTVNMFECVRESKATIYYVISFIIIPVYRFIVYPLVGRYTLSMLKSMGIGLFLCLVSTVISLAVDSFRHFYSNASHCIFHENTATGTISMPIYWVLVIEAVNGFGVVLLMCSLIEFVMAQTPNRMRGIIMGLVLTAFGFGALGGYLLTAILRHFPTATPSCVFYYYLVLSLLMLLILVVYVVLAKRYKLREREKHINVHAIVEEHYERYFDQEAEYMREVANRHRT